MNTDIEINSASDLLIYLRGRPGRNHSNPVDVDFVARLLHVEVWDDHLLNGTDVSATLKLYAGSRPDGQPNPSILYLNPRRHKDDFERRMMRPTFVDHHIDAVKLAEVRAAFVPHCGADGAHFQRLMHVRLLRRN